MRRILESAAAAAVMMITAAAAAQLTFPTSDTITAGDGARSVVAADFNGDGDTDLAVANRGADSAQVLLAGGLDRFLPPATFQFAAGSRPFAVAVGDFNGDDIDDLVVALEGVDSVAILLGLPLGQFVDPTLFGTGNSPRALAVGDFDNDQRLDVVTANREDDTVGLLYGRGDGTFEDNAPVPVTDGLRAQPEGVAVGDFNQDGALDFAVTRSFNSAIGVAVRLGDGLGLAGFGGIAEFAAGTDPRGIVAADMDADGTVDLVVANNDSDNVSVLLGAGDGTFASAGEFTAGNACEALAVGDVDGDGTLDVVTANREGDEGTQVSLLIGDGAGNLAAATNSAAGSAPVGVALADFDGDAKLDIVTANEEADTLSLLLSSEATEPPPGLPDCDLGACGPAGLMPVFMTFCGIAGIRATVRHDRRRRG